MPASRCACVLASVITGCAGGSGSTNPGDAAADGHTDVLAIPDVPCGTGSWTRREPPPGQPSPAPRIAAVAWYDEAAARTMLFGGNVGGDELWQWDGSAGSWANLTPDPRPPAWPIRRVRHGVAFDARTNRALIFGGTVDVSAAARNDLWEWDGARRIWTDRTPSPLPKVWPRARAFHAMYFDAGVRRLFLFGGAVVGGWANDFWELDPDTLVWTDRTPTPPASWPADRYSLNFVADERRDTGFLFGGIRGAGAFLGDLWILDPRTTTWSEVPRPTSAASWPAPRHAAALAFSPVRGTLLLFGGGPIDQPGAREMWEWDGAASSWTACTPSPLPTEWPGTQQEAVMVYDRRRRSLVLYANDGTVWERDGL